ncbi:hypothetical protein, partial [Mixta calida]|uniref:hypothetical protein n=1 Tax=Mixta calida TaxID=665913 RepID=UPI0028A74543
TQICLIAPDGGYLRQPYGDLTVILNSSIFLSYLMTKLVTFAGRGLDDPPGPLTTLPESNKPQ